MSLPLGSKLGSYEVLSLLGAGGMGEVYRAQDTRLGRVVAIKVLAAEVFGFVLLAVAFSSSSCMAGGDVIRFCRMSQTITVRLTKELAAWLEQVAAKMGVSQGRIIRDELEKAKASASSQAFMRLAGAVRGPKDLSSRRGFSRS